MYSCILNLPMAYSNYSNLFLPSWSWSILIIWKYWVSAELGLLLCVSMHASLCGKRGTQGPKEMSPN